MALLKLPVTYAAALSLWMILLVLSYGIVACAFLFFFFLYSIPVCPSRNSGVTFVVCPNAQTAHPQITNPHKRSPRAKQNSIHGFRANHKKANDAVANPCGEVSFMIIACFYVTRSHGVVVTPRRICSGCCYLVWKNYFASSFVPPSPFTSVLLSQCKKRDGDKIDLSAYAVAAPPPSGR